MPGNFHGTSLRKKNLRESFQNEWEFGLKTWVLIGVQWFIWNIFFVRVWVFEHRFLFIHRSLNLSWRMHPFYASILVFGTEKTNWYLYFISKKKPKNGISRFILNDLFIFLYVRFWKSFVCYIIEIPAPRFLWSRKKLLKILKRLTT